MPTQPQKKNRKKAKEKMMKKKYQQCPCGCARTRACVGGWACMYACACVRVCDIDKTASISVEEISLRLPHVLAFGRMKSLYIVDFENSNIP